MCSCIILRHCYTHLSSTRKKKKKNHNLHTTMNLEKHQFGVESPSYTVCLKAVETVDPQKLPRAS